MSESIKEIPEVGGGAVVIADIDDEDQEIGDGGVHENDDQKKKKVAFGFGYGSFCTENLRKAKKVVLFSISKGKKQIYHRRNKLLQQKNIKLSLSSSSSGSVSAAANGNGRFCGDKNRVKGCGFCFKQPHTLESPGESHSSDPNDPSFSCEMLKSLIEKNDFYSKECNPHLDFHNPNRTGVVNEYIDRGYEHHGINNCWKERQASGKTAWNMCETDGKKYILIPVSQG